MIIIERKQFLDGILIGGSMAGKAKTMPILEFVKCTLKGNSFVLSSYDTETAVTKRISVVENNEEDCSFCVSPKDLINILKNINDETVRLEISNMEMTIFHKKGKLVIPTHGAEEFPSPVLDSSALGCDVSSEKIYNWIKDASLFVAHDEIRAVLNGMFLYMVDGEIGVAATDGRKLYHDSDKCAYDGDEIKCIITQKAFSAILQMINESETTNILIGETNIVFKTDDAKVCTRIVEGKYPNYKAIIPKSANSQAEVDKREVIDSVKRAIIASDSNVCLVKLHLSTMMMDIKANDDTFGKKAQESCTCSFSGDEFTIGVQGQYLIDCLGVTSSNDITLNFIDATKPIVVKDEAEPNKVVVVMPMRVEY